MFKKLAFCGPLRWLNFVSSFPRLSAILNISSSLTRHAVTHRPAGHCGLPTHVGQEESKQTIQVYTISSRKKTRDLFSVCYRT